ncbi:MAG TPA: hypothetical protein H9741_07955 [Candidatus Borkfalkia faecipullorum]|uniref:Uncharacterized protein n=1 Tax=Candidatus Borkfalkia faecipullorum TaxID=2838510 RepID=A0A9D1V934_9FIRM|nr:hypothetical protein [Candidatus Borkfalkia faecipullorum]
MEDFNKFVKEAKDRGALPKDADAMAQSLARAFEGKGEGDILRAIYREAERGRRAGTLSDAELDNFVRAVSPMLDGAKRKKLEQVVKKLKKT